MDNTIRITGKMREAVKLPMCGKDSQGNLYEVDNLSLLKNGKRFFPVMGEFHYSRYEPADWEEEILKIADNETRTKITEKFRTLGFSYVTLDLQGFRSGSMNETLGK